MNDDLNERMFNEYAFNDYELNEAGLKVLEAIHLRIDQRRQQTAYHEAGHAVMAEFFGCSVRRITIVPEGTTRGQCIRKKFCYDELEETEVRTTAVNEMLILYAGYAAESLINQHPIPHTIDQIASSGSGSDHQRAWALLPKVLGDLDQDATDWERESYLNACRAFLNHQVTRAYKMLCSEPFKSAVKALANELLGWDELSGDEAREVMLKAVNFAAAHS